MRLLGLDFETTGLDTAKDRITEIGYVLWDSETQKPLITHGEFLYDESYPALSAEITRLTGITDAMLREFGTQPARALQSLADFCAKHEVRYIVAHNGENFDKPLLMAEISRAFGSGDIDPAAPEQRMVALRGIPWIDTKADIPYEIEPDSRKLKHLALDAGFINPFAHRAVFDVATMLRVLAAHSLEKVIEYQKIPWATLRAVVSFQEKELAKGLRYSWERLGEKIYPKFWVKRVKENQLVTEIAACEKAGFQSVRIE